MKKICKIRFGSHLYGTNTPESDEDYIGVFVPEERDILLGRIPKTAASSPSDCSRKNLPGEEDSTWFSLHHFLALACQGQTIAMDMLWAPDTMIEYDTHGWIWNDLCDQRGKFLSKNMKAFVGYARGQAAKYSLKGERLERLRDFSKVLTDRLRDYYDRPIRECWDALPRDDTRENPQGIRELQIAGKWYGESTSIEQVLSSVQNSINRYGNRAHVASEAGGVDWKAMSHAVRVSNELIDLLTYGELVFPLPYAAELLEIKNGKLPLDSVQAILDASLRHIEELMEASTLPEKVDREFWDNWLVETLS